MSKTEQLGKNNREWPRVKFARANVSETFPNRFFSRAIKRATYLKKARDADRLYNGTPEGQVGRVENKLLELGEVQGLVCGNWGEVSEPFYALIAELATSRRRVGRMINQRGRGRLRSEEAERLIPISSIRRRLGVATVKAQAGSLLGRLQSIAPGTRAAVGRRRHAQELERQWTRADRAAELATRQGLRQYRTGFAKLD